MHSPHSTDATAYDLVQGVPSEWSLAMVLLSLLSTAALRMTIPSYQCSVGDAVEKFSDPTRACAGGMAQSARMSLARMHSDVSVLKGSYV